MIFSLKLNNASKFHDRFSKFDRFQSTETHLFLEAQRCFKIFRQIFIRQKFIPSLKLHNASRQIFKIRQYFNRQKLIFSLKLHNASKFHDRVSSDSISIDRNSSLLQNFTTDFHPTVFQSTETHIFLEAQQCFKISRQIFIRQYFRNPSLP